MTLKDSGELMVEVITALLIWAGLWYICYWLYKNKVFEKSEDENRTRMTQIRRILTEKNP